MIERAVRRIQKVYEKQSIRALLFKIFIVNERFAVNESINQHVIRDLLDALKNEKKTSKKRQKVEFIRWTSLWILILQFEKSASD